MKIALQLFFLFVIEVVFSSMLNGIKAQSEYALTSYTTTEGLAHNSVYSICQDQTGFIWVSTFEGVSRFDGYEFKNYYANPDLDPISLPYFLVDKLVTDRSNNLLAFSCNKPIAFYNRALDRFEKLSINGNLNVNINDVLIDHKGNTWLVGLNEIYYRNNLIGNFKSFKVLDEKDLPFQLNAQTSITIDNKGVVWLFRKNSDGYSIYKAVGKNDSVLRMVSTGVLSMNNFKSFQLRNLESFDIYHSSSGKTWLFSKSGLYLFDSKQNRFTKYSSKVDPTEFTGKDYFHWMDEKSGINIIETGTNTHFTIPARDGNYFETSFIDRNKTIWAATVSKVPDNIGLKRYIRIPDYFKHYLTKKSGDSESHLVFPILKDRSGDIWAGINNSAFLFQIKPHGKINKVPYLNHWKGDDYPSPSSFVQDSSGMWIGCQKNQLLFYDYKTRQTKNLLENYDPADFQTSPGEIHTIIKVKNYLVINGTKGIYRYNLLTNEIRLYYKFAINFFGFTLISDGKTGFWIGFNSAAVVHLNADLKKDAEFRFGNRQDIVEHLCIGDQDDLWVALQGGGLGHLNIKTGKAEIFTTKNGLLNNTVYAIVKDKKGRLWITTAQGISSFNPATCKFNNFGKEDGLLFEKFNSESCFMASDGEIFFGGAGGIVSFYPEKILKIKEPENPLVITDFDVSGLARYFSKPVYQLDTIILKKGDNNFQVSFACLYFKNVQKIKYRYRLIGVTDIWHETNQRNRKITYFNLLPGDYLLEVEATDKNGNWVSKTALHIFIPFRIYETLWFKILLAAIVSAFLLAIVIFYNRQIRIKARHDLEELKLEALRNQMNPHFIFNSLNSINYFISKNDKLSANTYIADFARLIRSFLTNLSADFVPIHLELQTLQDYLNLEHLRFKDKFTYSIHKIGLDDSAGYHVFPGIIQPFIENAIWHGIRGLEGRMGHIEITLTKVSPDRIQCIIEDDGIGRNLSQKYSSDMPKKKSRGTGIVIERLQLYNSQKNTNYKLIIEDLYPDKEECGTRVVVDLPVKT